MAQYPSNDSKIRAIFDTHLQIVQRYCVRRLGTADANDAVSEVFSRGVAPIFDAFNQWAFANRRDVIDGPCADLDGTSDPAECAAAVLEVAHQYVADSNE